MITINTITSIAIACSIFVTYASDIVKKTDIQKKSELMARYIKDAIENKTPLASNELSQFIKEGANINNIIWSQDINSDHCIIHDVVAIISKRSKIGDIEREQLNQLIQHGADIDCKDNKGNTSLNIACMSTCSIDLIKYLLIEKNASPDICNNDGISPFKNFQRNYNAIPFQAYEAMQFEDLSIEFLSRCRNRGTFEEGPVFYEYDKSPYGNQVTH
jgi:hypothetical protein